MALVAPLGGEKPKLIYFNAPGVAEPIRLAFVLGGMEFEDVRINAPDWPTEKAKLPLGSVPVLQAGGVTMPQSFAILRRVARKAGLLPSDLDEIDHCEMVCETCRDVQMVLFPSVVPWIATVMQFTEEQRKAMREHIASESLPKVLEGLQSCLRGDYFCGSKITMCDLVAYCIIRWLKSGVIDHIPATVLQPYAKLTAFCDRMGAVPKIAAWNAQMSRCQSGMAVVAPLEGEKPKLIYFNAPGRAEPIRLAFVLGGMEFEDVRINGPDWPTEKAKFLLGAVPVLQAGGVTMPQSTAILRRVARKTGLLPSDLDDMDHCEMVCETCQDVQGALYPSMAPFVATVMQFTEEQKKAMREHVAKESLTKVLESLQSCLRGDYFCGSKVTMCDLVAYCTIRRLKSGVIEYLPATLMEPYGKLTAFCERMDAIPKIAAWNAEH